MQFQTIILEQKDHIGTITLNRPESLNSINMQMIDDLILALDAVNKDDEVRVLLLTGAGRAFCAGGDVKGSGKGKIGLGNLADDDRPEAVRQAVRRAQRVTHQLQTLEKPTIAVVNGVAVGAGFDLALACDIRIGSEKARFRVSFTKVGVIPGQGGAWLMPRVMGLPKAAELLFTADYLEAKEAERIGVLNKLVPSDQIEQEALALASRIASNPPLAIKLGKLLLNKGLNMDRDTALEMAAAAQPILIASEDHKEGIAAVVEKRPPVFRGR